MYKMVIVDDEELTRQGIRDSVNWQLMDIEIVGEAVNGLEAMLLIHDTNPDIIICDIRMPKLDGISLINEIQPSHPDLQVLFLSGYSDKEYLKHAIKLDAVDYIFKPFQLHELIAAVEKAKQNCQQKKAKSSHDNADIALELLQYNRPSADFPRQELPIDPGAPLVTLIIKLNESSLPPAANGYDNLFDARLVAEHYFHSFRTAAARIFDGKFVMSCIGAGYVLHANVVPDYLTRQSTRSRLSEFFTALDNGKAAIAVGIGNLCPSAERLHESYVQARDAVHAAFLVGYGKLIFYRELSTEGFTASAALQERFFEAVSGNRFTEATGFLEEYISYMQGCRPQDIPFIKDELAGIAFWLNEQIRSFSGESKKYVTDMINFASDVQSVKRYLLEQLDHYVNDISNLDNKGRILLEAEQYILQNYDKDLSIKAIAKKVFITPNYLCYLYKKKTGRTLNQFILDVKMDKARRLICETSAKLGEVADALGYANQNYFTRTFTKYFGESPRSYRNKHGSAGRIEPEEGGL